MSTSTITRRPRFRRASAPPAFRVTDGDLEILQIIVQHRFIRSAQIALLVGRSLDRTNDRLLRLYHAGYVDRPRAQLDYYPTSGSAPMVYALAELGALLLKGRCGIAVNEREYARDNGAAGRPFIEHQLEITEFWTALEQSARHRQDVRLIRSDELIREFPDQTQRDRNPASLRALVTLGEKTVKLTVIPDLIFGLRYPDGTKRCFMVEIDRGTMPVSRTDLSQSSFERKMRAYLAAYAAGEHERRFGWKAFRVLTVTADHDRLLSILADLRRLQIPQNPSFGLFLFALRDELKSANPLSHSWLAGTEHRVTLV